MLGHTRIALALIVLAAACSASLPTARSYFEARRDPRLPAVLSIQRHLEEVESRLRAHPPAGLDPERSAARAERLEELRAYRLRGDFPQNLDFPDRVIPYFIDARGVACAVGHLMLLSGGEALAREIAGTRNHIYLPEEHDPRLAAWARRNGLTLEECARIQPSYAPQNSDIIGLDLDHRGRPWVLTGKGMGNWGYVLSHRGDQGWTPDLSHHPDSFVQLCMVGENPLVLQATGFSWKGGTETAPEGDPMRMTACAAALDGKSFWLGSTRGARRYVIEGSGPPRLAETLRSGSDGLPGDTVSRMAQVGAQTWFGTSEGLVYGTNGNWTRQSLGTGQVGGLIAGTDQIAVWYGLSSGDQVPWRASYFSIGGFIRQEVAGGPQKYSRGNSPIPCDTVRMAAAGPGNSVWFTCDGRQLHRFIPPDRLETASFELPRATSILESDAIGRLYIGTYAPGIAGSSAQGLFRVTESTLEPLGYPVSPTALARPHRSESLQPFGLSPSLGLGGEAQVGIDILGRRSGHLRAAGMSVPESARRE